jgi:hypothetical protein
MLLMSACAFSTALPDDAGIEPDARERADADTAFDVDAGSEPSGSEDAAVPDAAPTMPDAAAGGEGVLLITEVVDGTLSGGQPTFVELSNSGDGSIDLSDFSLGVYNNGSTSLAGAASTVLSGTLAPGASYVVAMDPTDAPGASTFATVYGSDADNLELPKLINGNDTIVLFAADGGGASGEATGTGSDATIVDVYGSVGTDGLGQEWDYTDGFAERKPGVVDPRTSFSGAEWTFSGVDALEGMSAQEIAGATSPGDHSF